MKFFKISTFSICLILISILSFSNSVFAQESSSVRDYSENPEIDVTDIAIANNVYEPGDEVSGSFVLKNKKDFDTGDVFYAISLVGSDNEELEKYPKAYEFTDLIGPHYLQADGEEFVTFSFTLPDSRPKEYLGIRFDVFSETGLRLGNSEMHIDTIGEIVEQLEVLNPSIILGDVALGITQKPIIYSNEQASFRYVINNILDEDVLVEPIITIKNINDSNEIIAKYNEPKIQVNSGQSASVINSIRTFDDTPGSYVARIELVNELGQKISAPLIYRYVVDGDIASIKSVFVSSDSDLNRGEEFVVVINYEGKPFDVRNTERNQVVRDAIVFVEVTNTNGQILSKNTITTNLESKGKLEIPFVSEYYAEGYSIKIRITKDGELLDENILEVPFTNNGEETPFYTIITFLILVLILIAYIFFNKMKAKGIFVSIALLFTLFGFAPDADALTTVYTVGDANYIPSNITIDYYDPEVYYSGVDITLYYDVNEPASYDSQITTAYSMWDGTSCSYINGSCSYATDPWYDGPPAAQLTEDSCSVGDDCDETNYNYWQTGSQSTSDDEYCDAFGCQKTSTFTLAGPYEEGTFRAYFYIRNEYSVGGEEYVGAALVYEDIEFYDPYSSGSSEEYCYGAITGNDPGEGVTAGTEITWILSPEFQFDDPLASCHPNNGDGCLGGYELGVDTIEMRWTGDIGDSASSTISQAFVDDSYIPESLHDWFKDSSQYCQTYPEQGCGYTCSAWVAEFENNRCSRSVTEPGGEICEYVEYCDGEGFCDTVEECTTSEETTTTEYYNVTDADLIWNNAFTTTYSSSSLPADGVLDVVLEYRVPIYSSTYSQLACLPLNIGNDLCANLAGVQAVVPSGFDVYPDPDNLGVGETYADLNCYPVSLARAGTVSISADPATIDLDGALDWIYSLSSNFFSGTLDSITYTIPRITTVTWSEDISDSAYTSGIPGSSSGSVTFNNPDLSDVDNDLSVSYSEEGSPSVTITIEDPYLSISDTGFATVAPPVCESECDPCPTEEVCDNNVPGDDPEITSFTISPVIANEDNTCYLSWDTNNYTESCELNTQSGDVTVATSSASYAVGPGVYSLTCLNYAPEETTEGPLSCLQNPDLREQ